MLEFYFSFFFEGGLIIFLSNFYGMKNIEGFVPNGSWFGLNNENFQSGALKHTYLEIKEKSLYVLEISQDNFIKTRKFTISLKDFM